MAIALARCGSRIALPGCAACIFSFCLPLRSARRDPRGSKEEDRSLCIHETVTHWAAAGRADATHSATAPPPRRYDAQTRVARPAAVAVGGRSEGNKSVMHLFLRQRPVSRSSGRASERVFARSAAEISFLSATPPTDPTSE